MDYTFSKFDFFKEYTMGSLPVLDLLSTVMSLLGNDTGPAPAILHEAILGGQ